MAHTVVHKAAPQVVPTILERFWSRGVDAEAVDDPNWIVLLISFGTYRVRIAVPDEQVDEAKGVLEEWDNEARPNVRKLSRQVYRQFFVAGVLALVVAGVLFALGHVWLTLPAFLFVWLATVALLGLLERARLQRESEET
jgi:hypothetical protein